MFDEHPVALKVNLTSNLYELVKGLLLVPEVSRRRELLQKLLCIRRIGEEVFGLSDNYLYQIGALEHETLIVLFWCSSHRQ